MRSSLGVTHVGVLGWYLSEISSESLGENFLRVCDNILLIFGKLESQWETAHQPNIHHHLGALSRYWDTIDIL